VINGLAAAPPAIVFKIGVYTYTNPLFYKKFLKYFTIKDLVEKV